MFYFSDPWLSLFLTLVLTAVVCHIKLPWLAHNLYIDTRFERHQTYLNYPCFQSQSTRNHTLSLALLIPLCVWEGKKPKVLFAKTHFHENSVASTADIFNFIFIFFIWTKNRSKLKDLFGPLWRLSHISTYVGQLVKANKLEVFLWGRVVFGLARCFRPKAMLSKNHCDTFRDGLDLETAQLP